MKASQVQVDGTEQLFILGAPRSGTTFLASLLAKTRFGTPIESHFITKYYKRLDRYGSLNSKENFTRLVHDILAERPVMQWRLKLDIETLHCSLKHETDGSVEYADLVEALFLARPRASGRNAWGDKTPHYIADIAVLNRLFPDSRYLYIVRDGRDVALSLFRKDWGPNNILAAAEYWARLNADNDCFQYLYKKNKILFLRYEDLAEDVEGAVQRICEFLDETVSDEELKKLASTVIKDNSYKWRTQLQPRQLHIFDGVAGDTLKRFGYEIGAVQASPNLFVRAAYRSHDRLVWLCFMFKTNVIDGFRIRFLGKEPFAD